jgi:hypothetical protein
MRIAPRDSALPLLRELVREDHAPEFVCEALNGMLGQSLASRGDLTYVRYRPGKDCTVLWSFERAGREPLLLTGTAFANDRGLRISARASFLELAAQSAHDDVKRPFTYLPERRLLLQVFPLDVRIPPLAAAMSEGWTHRTLEQALAPDMTNLWIEPVTYKPRHRYVARCHVETPDGMRTYYAKVFRDDRGKRLFDWQTSVASALNAIDASWITPRPAAHIDSLWMLFIESVEGTELKHALRRAREDEATRATVLRQFGLAAHGLSEFQSTSVPSLPQVTPQQILDHFAVNIEGVAAVDPALATAFQRTLRDLEEEASRLPPERFVTCHGALRHDQILLQHDRQVVVDLDTICAAGASHDAGNFLSYLDVTALRRRHSRDLAEHAASVFETEVLRLPSSSPEWLRWYRRAGHVKKTIRAFLSLDSKWPQLAREYVGLTAPAAVSA